ncbi:MAG: SdpI family protein [Evtepia sp.]
MRRNEPRGRLLALTLLILGAALLAQVLGGLAGLVLLGAILLGVVWDLARHLEDLTDLPADSPKWKPLRWVTAFDAALVLVCVRAACWRRQDTSWTEAGEQYFALPWCWLLLFLGNLAPKLPFSRHTGLRLPWTVADEDTWTVAHRLVGYLSFPLALVYLAGLSLTAQFEVLTLGVFLLWVGVPGLLSYLYFRRKWIP